MEKTTQTIHKFPVTNTPAGPVELEYNLESGWFAITAPQQIPFNYLDILLVALGIIQARWQGQSEDDSTIRSDDIEADWLADNLLAKKE